MNLFKCLFLFLFFAGPGFLSLSSAAPPGTPKRAFIRGGAISTNIGRVATEDNGESSGTLNRTYSALGFGFQFGQTRLSFTPSLDFTPLGVSTIDDSTTDYLVKVALTPAYRLTGPFDFKLGPGILYEIMIGHGGTTDLNNGTSTSTFFKPSRNTTQLLLFWEAGLAIRVSERIRMDLDTFVTGVLSSERAFNFASFLAWGFL